MKKESKLKTIIRAVKNKIRYFFYIVEKITRKTMIVLVFAYKILKPVLFFMGSCRFYPSCSSYALMALKKYNFQKAFKLIFFRLIKCRPGGPFGYDPVP